MRIEKYTSRYFEFFDGDVPLGHILIKGKKGEVHFQNEAYTRKKRCLRKDIKEGLEEFESEYKLKSLMVYV